MAFEYNWKNNEANFGPPVSRQVDGGLHITFEIVLKKDGKYIGLRRQSIPGHESPPNSEKHLGGMLFFCHNLIRYGESVEDCVKRIVKEQTGVDVRSLKIAEIDSSLQEKDDQWAFTPYVIAELSDWPKKGLYGNEITEVVTFTKNNAPEDFGWWSKKELEDFLNKFD
ncbi:NUDIX domain-containing protein [Candidatus Pacearchaeota archaeon]|nr:NUDIX domain-containing protein [Candidatus Pacearchaeota archaeon]